jgi:hypothetical protein
MNADRRLNRRCCASLLMRSPEAVNPMQEIGFLEEPTPVGHGF